MTGPDQTRAFLLCWMLALGMWEVYAICFLDRALPHGQPRSTVSAILGELVVQWPPIMALATGAFVFALFHFWSIGNGLKP